MSLRYVSKRYYRESVGRWVHRIMFLSKPEYKHRRLVVVDWEHAC
ncbi:MAG: hypothetical protein QW756_00335 [Nitrososphaerota archaeon]